MLDAVRHAELFEEHDELAQFFNEPVLIFSRGDGDEHYHVVGEIVEAVRVCEDDERGSEYHVFREEACAVGVILIAILYSECPYYFPLFFFAASNFALVSSSANLLGIISRLMVL